MSSVQTSLKTSFDETPPAPADFEGPAGPACLSAPASPGPEAARDEEVSPSPRAPANDDARFAGDVLRALQQRPSNWPYLLAAIASGLYLGSVAVFGRFDPARLTEDLDGLLSVALVGCPVVAFVLLAAFARQVQRVRHSAHAMTRLAARLLSPAATAGDEVSSLSQSVRMEISALTDGIERGVTQLGDLEVVASDLLRRLEEAHSRADAKMHSLTRQLSSERESLETYAERIGDTLLHARDQIDLDLSAVADQISARVRQESASIMIEVEDRARATIDEAHQRLDEKARELGELLEACAASTIMAVEESCRQTEAACYSLSAHNAANLDALKGVLTEAEREFAVAQARSIDVFSMHAETIANALHKSGSGLTEKSDELLQRLGEFDTRYLQRLSAAAGEVRGAGEALGAALAGFETKIEGLAAGAGANLDTLSTSLRSEFDGQIAAFEAQVGRNAGIMKETLDQAMETVNSSFLDGLRQFSDIVAGARPEEELLNAAAEMQRGLQVGFDQFRREYQQLCGTVSGLFERNSAEVGEGILRASEAASERMRDAGALLCASVHDTGGVVLRDLDALRDEILQSMQDASAASAKSVEEAAKAPIDKVRAECDRFQEDAKKSLRNLNEVNASIRSSISAAEQRISAVASSLATQTEIYLNLVEANTVRATAHVGDPAESVRAPVHVGEPAAGVRPVHFGDPAAGVRTPVHFGDPAAGVRAPVHFGDPAAGVRAPVHFGDPAAGVRTPVHFGDPAAGVRAPVHFGEPAAGVRSPVRHGDAAVAMRSPVHFGEPAIGGRAPAPDDRERAPGEARPVHSPELAGRRAAGMSLRTADVDPIPDRRSPTWISRLLARASIDDEASRTPRVVSDLVDMKGLVQALANMERGACDGIDLRVYRPLGLSIFRQIEARYAGEADFRVAADAITASFLEALNLRLEDSNGASDWKSFIEEHVAGLITAHAIGAIGII